MVGLNLQNQPDAQAAGDFLSSVTGPFGPFNAGFKIVTTPSPAATFLNPSIFGFEGYMFWQVSNDGTNFGPWVWRYMQFQSTTDRLNSVGPSYTCWAGSFG